MSTKQTENRGSACNAVVMLPSLWFECQECGALLTSKDKEDGHAAFGGGDPCDGKLTIWQPKEQALGMIERLIEVTEVLFPKQSTDDVTEMDLEQEVFRLASLMNLIACRSMVNGKYKSSHNDVTHREAT